MKMAVAVMERDRISELAGTEEIMELRRQYQKLNEMSYANGGIEHLAYMLSGISGQNIYENKIIKTYFEILDTKNFLLEKYSELPDIEALKHEKNVKDAIDDADETLTLIEQCI